MLVVLLCCMMKLVEISAIASSPYHFGGGVGGGNDPPPPVLNNTLGSLPQPSAHGKCKREDVVSVKRKRRRRFKRINGLIIDGGGRRFFAKNNLTTASGQQQQLNPMTVGDMAVPIIGGGGVIVTTKGSPHSPTDSDCNSNPHQNNASCLSNTSSQDIEFIQDNNDYQWFLDYGYRDNNHTSILSLAESYEAQDLGYYDTLAKNMDANLAEADIESFRTEDIHALLTNLPPMCTDQLSQENNRQGESYASISNSLLGLHFTNSHHSTSHQSNASSSSQSNQLDYSANNDSMSICKSELLFSPVKEVPEGGSLFLPPGGVNFSVDSLDCDDLMLTCQNTNMENYTIAFEGSGGMGYGEEEGEEIEWAGEVERNNSDRLLRHYSSSQQKSHVARLLKKHNNCGKISFDSMTQSDSGNLTTWSKLKKLNRIEGKMERHPSGNNNQATVDDSATQATLQFGANMTGQTVKSQSMPNLCRRKTSSSNQLPQGRIVAPSMLSHMYLVNRSQLNSSDSSTECPTLKRKPVKVFNIQHQSTTSGSGGSVLSEMATSVDGGSTSSAHSKSHAQNFSLVKLFMKQKSISAEGMSTGLDDQSSISENWNLSNSCNENKQTISNFDDSLLQTNKYNNDTSAIVHNKQQFVEKDNKNTKLNQIDLTLNLNKSFSNNNNNSSLELSDYNAAKRTHQKLKSRMTNAKRSNKNVAAANQTASSDSSCFANSTKPPLHKHVPIHLMNKSIQTSTLDNLANITNKPAPYKLNGGCPRTTHHQQARCERFKVVEPSFLSKLKREGEVEQTEKPVYVLYPNYVLPNLDFLHEKNDSTKVILLPQQTKPLTSPRSSHTANSPSNRRPFSCNDLEAILKSGGGRNQFAHVRDWDSLLPLLPHDYQRVLASVPEVRGDGRKQPMGVERTASLDRGGSYCCNSSSSGCRGSSTILSSDISTPSCATKFNPLFVYRYDSATSSETSQTTHAHANVPPALPKRLNLINGGGKYDAVPPPRPPLPRGILRRGNAADVKMRPRYSMFEMTEEEFYSEIANKRRSLQEPYQGVIRNKRLSETEDEGVDAGTSSSSLDSNDHQFQQSQNPPKIQNPNYNNPHNNPTHIASHNQPENMSNPHNSVLFANLSNEDLRQLEDFLQQSNSSLDNNNGSRNGNDHGSREVLGDDVGMLELRSQVSRFLALRINSQCQEAAAAICGGAGRKVSFRGEPEGRGPNNSPLNVSCTTAQRSPNAKSPGTLLVDMPDIHEEATPSTNSSNPSFYHSSPRHHTKRPPQSQLSSIANPQPPVLRSTSNKQHQLIAAVTEAVEGIIRGFSPATNQPELDALGDSARNPNGARVTLTRLCPALYAVLSDGLKGVLETSFGPIGNSVWQVVEASAQQGPLTKALNDLVMKINSEDVITEGLVKFNAFVFGLLNVRSLDAWLSYLRTRESVLRKHYEPEALLVQALMGGTEVRQLLDGLIATVQPLALLPFQYDLLFEYRLLHESLKKMDTYQQQLSPTHQQFKSWKTDNAAAPTDNAALPDLLNNSTSTTPPHLTVKASNSQINHAPKVRPRSYVDYFRQPATARGPHQSADHDDSAHEHCHQPRRWSGISANHKLFQAYSKLEVDEEYTDSLEEFCGGGDGGGATPCILTSATTCLANGSNNQPESLESNMSLNDEKPLNGRKFKKLQRRWEMLSGTNTSPPDTPSLQQHQHYQKDAISPPNLISNNQTNTNPYSLPNSSPSGNGGSAATASAAARLSKIPRPVTSPVKPVPCSGNSGIPVPVSPPGGGVAHVGKSGGRKVVTPPSGGGVGMKRVGGAVGVNPVKKPVAAPRTSRLDQLEQNAQETRILTRPSSLPYKPHNSASKGSKMTPPRRAISTSVNRKGVNGAGTVIQTKLPNTLIELPEINEIPNKSQTKVVRTLSHRLPSESGHLPYNEGERLKVVLEVDGQWLLCCRGTQKGLVPRTAVIACDTLIPGSRF